MLNKTKMGIQIKSAYNYQLCKESTKSKIWSKEGEIDPDSQLYKIDKRELFNMWMDPPTPCPWKVLQWCHLQINHINGASNHAVDLCLPTLPPHHPKRKPTTTLWKHKCILKHKPNSTIIGWEIRDRFGESVIGVTTRLVSSLSQFHTQNEFRFENGVAT